MAHAMKFVDVGQGKSVFEVRNETGTARMTRLSVYPGIDILYMDAHIQEFSCYAHPLPGVFAINHCEEGRIEYNFRNGEYLYMGQGDMCLGWRGKAEYCHTVFFPSSHYHGISLIFNVPEAQPLLDNLLAEDRIDLTALCNRFCCDSDFGIIMEENRDMKHLFYELYHVPEKIQKRYYRLKILETLLFLSVIENIPVSNQTFFSKSQVETVKSIQLEITQTLKGRITIEELSDRYQIAPTTLKKCFKGVYGKSIYQYLKDFRISEAKRQLMMTDDTILAIANRVGYENCSKFAVAFQKKTGMLPKNYRRMYCK